MEIVHSVGRCIDQAVAKFNALGHSVDQIKTTGITNQRVGLGSLYTIHLGLTQT
jgi:hypothetical protein